MSTIERARNPEVNGQKPLWKELADIANQMWQEDKSAFEKFMRLTNLDGVVLSTPRIARIYSGVQVGQESNVIISRGLKSCSTCTFLAI